MMKEKQDVRQGKKRRKPSIYMRVVEGGFVPVDHWAQAELRKLGLRVGDIVGIVIHKLRSLKFNRLVHKIGDLCVRNIEDFRFNDAHGAIKRLQLEGDIECSVVKIRDDFGNWQLVKVPQSISFDSMDETAFRRAAFHICTLISEKYWPDMSPEQIAHMADFMVDEP